MQNMEQKSNLNSQLAPFEKICHVLLDIHNAVENAQRFFLSPNFRRVQRQLHESANQISFCTQLLDDMDSKCPSHCLLGPGQLEVMRGTISPLCYPVYDGKGRHLWSPPGQQMKVK